MHWTDSNDLKPNTNNSEVCSSPVEEGGVSKPPLLGIDRVDSLNNIGVVISRNLLRHMMSMKSWQNTCTRVRYRPTRSSSLYMRYECLRNTVYQVCMAITRPTINRITYARQAWWGFACAADRARMRRFLGRFILMDLLLQADADLNRITE